MNAQPSTLSCLIIDDEEDARRYLSMMINEFCPQLNILGEADSVVTGKEAIKNLQPDIVFLDIHMPGGSGFDLLKALGPIDFILIFTTAYDRYAIKAFRFSALDYLLKPVEPDLLVEVIEKAFATIGQVKLKDRYESLLMNYESDNTAPKRLVLPMAGKFKVVEIGEIMYCAADGNYTQVHLKDRSRLVVSKQIKEFDELLSEHRFFRIHQSYLVNLNYVQGFTKGQNGEVELHDGTSLSLARSKKKEFLGIFGADSLSFQD